MEKKEGKFLVNARVDVDYTGKKPKIKFGYPVKDPKKEQLTQGGLPQISMLLLFFLALLPAPFLVPSFNYSDMSYPEECGDVSFDQFKYNKIVTFEGDYSSLDYDINYSAVYGFNVTCDNQTHEIDFRVGNPGEAAHFSSYEVNYVYILVIISWAFWIILSSWIAAKINKQITKRLVKSPKYQKWLPKHNAERGIIFKKRYKKYSKFLPKDVLDNIVVIPYFTNVELDYQTSGDFSKYLKKLKIREYQTNSINIKTKKTGKMKQHVCKWYAVFYFSEKPKTGSMEVTYQ